VIVVDSSVWIDYFRGKRTVQAECLDGLLGSQPIAVGDLMLTEVLQGFRDDREFDQAVGLFSSLEVIELGGRDVAIRAAAHFRWLRARGVSVRKTIDTIIATRCIVDGHALLFSDRDFEPFVRHLGLRDALHA